LHSRLASEARLQHSKTTQEYNTAEQHRNRYESIHKINVPARGCEKSRHFLLPISYYTGVNSLIVKPIRDYFQEGKSLIGNKNNLLSGESVFLWERVICSHETLVVCNEREERIHSKIRIIPYKIFLKQLWDGKIIH